MNRVSKLCSALVLVLAVAPAIAAEPDRGELGQPVLHVPSPDWRDQVLYFVMTDRFDDGEPANNDQRAGEFDPADATRYNGGDFRGIERRIDYLRGLGVTGVWITPPVLNRWWDPRAQHGGYHGYWAKDFSAVDPHLGTLADYRRLSRKLHQNRMVLVQDIVLNHTADYFHYEGEWDPTDPAKNFGLTTDSVGHRGPTQPPFDRNDAREGVDRRAAAYHWTPDVRDFRDEKQTHDWQMSGLDDLNSENPEVRRALRRSYGHWIRAVGVDGFRIDTAFYVPRGALSDFLYAKDGKDPGVMQVGADTGRESLLVFGEGFAIDKAYEESQAKKIETLMQADDGKPLLPGMLNFPLYGSIGDVFARGAPSAVLGHRIASMMRVHARPELMPSFLDNHDVDRFLAGGSEAGLRQGLLLLFTLPGIPTIYYGTEQGLRGQRAAMFAAGSGSGGKDNFDTSAPLYRLIAALAKLRHEHRLFSRGRPTVLAENPAGPGVLAYRMTAGDESALVLFNTGEAPALLDNLELGLAANTHLPGLFALDGSSGEAVAGSDGRLSLVLPPRGGRVYGLPPTRATAEDAEPSARAISLDALPPQIEGDFVVSGRAPPGSLLQLVADGEVERAAEVRVGSDGRWRARIDTSAMIDPAIRHRLVAWSEADGAVSEPAGFVVLRRWRKVAELEDPAGDDRGPRGNYVYPTDPSWASRPLDIRGVRVETAGGALRVSVRMSDISRVWNPPNGFDHVAFNVFVQLPVRAAEGVAAMPGQNDVLPEGLRWNLRLRAHGWSNALFAAEGADATHDGRAAVPAATIVADPDSETVTFTLAAAALGNPASLSGTKIYMNTWDYDGGYRPLEAAPAGMRFGGGDGARDPLWMDASAVIELP